MTTPIRDLLGPLVVSPRNPRYFTHRDDPSGRAVYLTGSHIWNNLHDGMGPGAEPSAEPSAEPEAMDFDAYLTFLTDRGHNFIRLWRWEQFRSQVPGGNYHLNMSPQPWARTGPGEAKDGKPAFDLTRFDESFFQRLRERVVKAGERGIYVGVMLFEGWALHLSPSPDNIEGHPFHERNNVNGVAATSIDDLHVLPLDPRVEQIQRAFIARVIDTLHDLPNVLWEVANESSGDGDLPPEFADFLGVDELPSTGDSTAWQYWVIDVVAEHERTQGYASHPIGMTMQYPVKDTTRVNEPLYASRAAWISPGYDDDQFRDGGHPMAPDAEPSRWLTDPPVNDGAKIVVSDTDHYAPGGGSALWAWKSFLRGHHPILMDFGLIAGLEPTGEADPEAGVPPFDFYEPARFAMGDTRRYAERLSLVDAQPRTDTASTGYALVVPGREMLVLEPTGGVPFTVELSAGRWRAGWWDVDRRVAEETPAITVEEAGPVQFTAPFDGAAVLHLTLSASQEEQS